MDCLLHDHADGAFPVGAKLEWLYIKNGKPLPRPGINLRNMVRAKFTDPNGDIVEAFSHTTGLMQSEETIFEVAKNHVIIRARQGIRYDEVMLAPQYHLFGEFQKEAKNNPVKALTRVINAVVMGIKAGEEASPKIEANFLVGIGRELSPRKAIQVLKAIEKSDRNHVVGANIVCDKNKFPPERHRATFEYADTAEINFEFHASEWIRRPKQNPDFQRDLPMLLKDLRFVLELYKKSRSKTKKRVGHGIALPYDTDLMRIASDYGIGITGCPGSNLQGKNIPDLESLKIKTMLLLGILWSMNPDDDFFQLDINEIFQMCNDVYRFTLEEKQLMRISAWKTRFGNRKPVPSDIYPFL
ncbi:MAG: hypothetical protein A3B86_01160 [Candidatus Yanofskybacteria bacterium RIFCSPHIGHO2_02_FULL_38_22b]|uniref:Adenosine deaminase domain-containing protein n=1 Tax=Candidatus Yanofskybacteria bacterium RIFCSPHIGHO2_02_FULL_38_22b TaxID=1802673 RepID=A0A1F8F525_9BACT|nr:MAG: hypothetical protein A3B86_01160 [Candidatus Yanofskybacteria bacterium RIFCSPHIGHO2_02_FULL_38_22b]OGN20401.1 MAG: hypothetical protein A2910_01510 [Candidatus Yanofskybacteria bacterium RIFCSPLOWO2_01_FULL_39_28]